MPEQVVRLPLMRRDAEVRADTFDDDSNTIDLIWTTGSTVRRRTMSFFGPDEEFDEELIVSANAVRLDRLNSGAPFLNTHGRFDLSQVIGTVVEGSARIEGGLGVAKVKLSRAASDSDVVQKIRDGIVRNVSVGYLTHRIEKEERDGSVPLHRVVDWEPMEISAVPIGADPGAHVRSDERGEEDLFECVVNRADDPSAVEAAFMEGNMPQTKRGAAPENSGNLENVETEAPEVREADQPVETREPEERVAKPAPKAESRAVAPQPIDVGAEVQRAIAADRARTAEISALAERYSLGADFLRTHAGSTVQEAKDAVLEALAARDVETTAFPHVRMQGDSRDRFKEGASKAILARAGIDGGERNEFSALTLRELARMSIESRGIAVPFDAMEMVGTAMGLRSSGMHSTSDFVEILANVANKAMLKGYLEAEETFDTWTARGSLVDFKAHKRIDLNLFPSLSKVEEGAEYTFGTMGDRAESISLATYGRMFAITRQSIINDDMNVFTRIPSRMGRAARRTIGNLVYAVLTDNAAMADNIALFHADHSNLASSGAAPTVTTLDAGRSKMARQTDPDSHATGGLNIRPRFFLVPVELEGTARVLMTAEFDPAKTQRVPNHVNGMATVISDARLSDNSTKAWYLAADPMAHDTIEVAYLNGNDQPTLEQRDGWNVDGVEFKVRIDAGVKALDFRGLYKDPGE